MNFWCRIGTHDKYVVRWYLTGRRWWAYAITASAVEAIA